MMIATIPPETVLETLAADLSTREKVVILAWNYAYLIRQRQMREDIDFAPLSRAIIDQLGVKALERVVNKAWRIHRAWVKTLMQPTGGDHA